GGVVALRLGPGLGAGYAPLAPAVRVVGLALLEVGPELGVGHGADPAALGQGGRGVAQVLLHVPVAHDVAERGGQPQARGGAGGDGRLDTAAAPAARHLLGGERGDGAPAPPAVRLLDAQGHDPGHGVTEDGVGADVDRADGAAVHAHLVVT